MRSVFHAGSIRGPRLLQGPHVRVFFGGLYNCCLAGSYCPIFGPLNSEVVGNIAAYTTPSIAVTLDASTRAVSFRSLVELIWSSVGSSMSLNAYDPVRNPI